MAGFLGGLVKNALSNVYSSGVSGFTRLNINQFNNIEVYTFVKI